MVRLRPIRVLPLTLPTETEALDYRVIFVDIAALQVIQKFTTTGDHFEQPATRVVVFFVHLEVLGELIDALREQCDLHLRRPAVVVVRFVITYDLFFYFFCCCHVVLP